MTRNPNGNRAKQLVDLHKPTSDNPLVIEPCYCDWFDESCLINVLKDVDVVFAMTDYWSPDVMNEEKEYQIGASIVKAAIINKVKLFIWSSLDNATKISRGKYQVPHFASKARVEEYMINEAKKIDMNWVVVKPGAFFTSPHGGSRYATTLKPDTNVPFFDPVNDTGPVIATIIENPEHYYGKTVYMFGEFGTYRQLSKLASKSKYSICN